jgi:hypothetical protein
MLFAFLATRFTTKHEDTKQFFLLPRLRHMQEQIAHCWQRTRVSFMLRIHFADDV